MEIKIHIKDDEIVESDIEGTPLEVTHILAAIVSGYISTMADEAENEFNGGK